MAENKCTKAGRNQAKCARYSRLRSLTEVRKVWAHCRVLLKKQRRKEDAKGYRLVEDFEAFRRLDGAVQRFGGWHLIRPYLPALKAAEDEVNAVLLRRT